MPRPTLGLLALVLVGCMPAADPSESDSDLALRGGRDGHGDRHAPWEHPKKGHRWHGPDDDHDDYDRGDDAPTVEDLVACLDACIEASEDDGCGDDDHWRRGGHHADSPEECQALWDQLDATDRTAARDELEADLKECGVEVGGASAACEEFVAEDDFIVFSVFSGDVPPTAVEFDVFAGDIVNPPDSVRPFDAEMAVISDTTRADAPSVVLDPDGFGVWSAPADNIFAQFTYVACCVDSSSGEADTTVCDDAVVTLLAC